MSMIHFFEVIGLVALLNALLAICLIKFLVQRAFIFSLSRHAFQFTTLISILIVGYLFYGFELEYKDWEALHYPSELLTWHCAILFTSLASNVVAAVLLSRK